MNKELLKYYIAHSGLTQADLARKLGISRQAMYTKISGRGVLRLDEVAVISSLLGLSLEEIGSVFFDKIVDRQSTRGIINGA